MVIMCISLPMVGVNVASQGPANSFHLSPQICPIIRTHDMSHIVTADNQSSKPVTALWDGQGRGARLVHGE